MRCDGCDWQTEAIPYMVGTLCEAPTRKGRVVRLRMKIAVQINVGWELENASVRRACMSPTMPARAPDARPRHAQHTFDAPPTHCTRSTMYVRRVECCVACDIRSETLLYNNGSSVCRCQQYGGNLKSSVLPVSGDVEYCRCPLCCRFLKLGHTDKFVVPRRLPPAVDTRVWSLNRGCRSQYRGDKVGTYAMRAEHSSQHAAYPRVDQQ